MFSYGPHVLEQDFKIYRAQPVPNRETHEVELWAGPWQRKGSVEYTISYEYLMQLGKKERLYLRNYNYDHFRNILRIECCETENWKRFFIIIYKWSRKLILKSLHVNVVVVKLTLVLSDLFFWSPAASLFFILPMLF